MPIALATATVMVVALDSPVALPLRFPTRTCAVNVPSAVNTNVKELAALPSSLKASSSLVSGWKCQRGIHCRLPFRKRSGAATQPRIRSARIAVKCSPVTSLSSLVGGYRHIGVRVQIGLEIHLGDSDCPHADARRPERTVGNQLPDC